MPQEFRRRPEQPGELRIFCAERRNIGTSGTPKFGIPSRSSRILAVFLRLDLKNVNPLSRAAVNPEQLAQVSKICVANDAGFELNWAAKSVSTGSKTASSGNYPIDQTRCMSLSFIPGVKEGDKVLASVHAVLGKTNDVSTQVVYKENGLGATFMCTGTTLNFKCALVQMS
eukprot:Hpha_TRINITY_DN16261_c0_g2::TRINITY_DN16261_c0_g2_i1::g.12839::m.12839